MPDALLNSTWQVRGVGTEERGKKRYCVEEEGFLGGSQSQVPAKFDKCPVSFCRLKFLEFIETEKSIRKILKYLSFFGVYLDKLDK